MAPRIETTVHVTPGAVYPYWLTTGWATDNLASVVQGLVVAGHSETAAEGAAAMLAEGSTCVFVTSPAPEDRAAIEARERAVAETAALLGVSDLLGVA